MKILVVEDHAASRQALSSLLQGDVLTAMDAGDGIASLERQPDIQILLLRWNLSNDPQGAVLLCRQARALPRDRYLYIIVLAAPNERADLTHALESGADAFVLTPVEVSELQAHLKVAERIAELEESLAVKTEQLLAVHRSLLDMEVEKRRIYRDVMHAVSRGKLHLVDVGDISVSSKPYLDLAIDAPDSLATIRQKLRQVAYELGMPEDRVENLVTASGEALTNALRHAVHPQCTICVEANRVTVRVADQGQGMALTDLPDLVLRPGSSSKVSMGAGFEIILMLVDEVWLATGPLGTVVQLCQGVAAPTLGGTPYEAYLARLDREQSANPGARSAPVNDGLAEPLSAPATCGLTDS